MNHLKTTTAKLNNDKGLASMLLYHHTYIQWFQFFHYHRLNIKISVDSSCHGYYTKLVSKKLRLHNFLQEQTKVDLSKVSNFLCFNIILGFRHKTHQLLSLMFTMVGQWQITGMQLLNIREKERERDWKLSDFSPIINFNSIYCMSAICNQVELQKILYLFGANLTINTSPAYSPYSFMQKYIGSNW